MSQTMSSGRGMRKSTCRACNRTVHVVTVEVESGRFADVPTDPELIAVVQDSRRGAAQKILVRRVHAEMCMRYQSEAAKLRADQQRKREQNPGAKRAPTGRREPGQ